MRSARYENWTNMLIACRKRTAFMRYHEYACRLRSIRWIAVTTSVRCTSAGGSVKRITVRCA